ncbi:MAG: biotin--[acetyl-CoA-carboxylase] ligase [Candidatus Rokuibacteriota bacterium]
MTGPWQVWRVEGALPDRGLARRFEGCLPGPPLAGPLLAYASTSSTQEIGRTLGREGAPEGTVIVADHQFAGRGRRGRAWIAPPGSALLFSVLFRPSLPWARWPELTLAAACAVAEAVEARTGLAPTLKWPNDVLVGDRKLAGILAEGVLGHAAFLVLGIGLNVSQRSLDWPAELARRGVSLAQLGRPVDREALLADILGRLAAHYRSLTTDGFGPVRDAWRARALLGGSVSGVAVTGSAVDVAPNGGLVVRRPDGTTTTIVAGEADVLAPSAPERGA